MAEYDHPTAFCAWGREERRAIKRVLGSGRFTMGPEVEAFESEFAAFHTKRHAIMVNSGSSANLVATAAVMLKVAPPFLAAVPAVAWSTTYAPLVQHGMDLTVLDCDETWNAPAPRERTDAGVIVACSILGNPGYLKEWRHMADENRAILIEDNCESFGAHTPEGKLCGTYGHISTFSFFYSHQIGAIEGGMILTDDDGLAELCRMLRAHGWTRDVAKPKLFAEEYDFRVFGYNVRPLELHAAIAREQLKKQERFAVRRRNNANAFAAAVAERRIPITVQRPRGVQNPFGLSFLLPEGGEVRERVARALRKAGIDCRLPTGGSFRLHPYAARWASAETPYADQVHRQGMFLGNAPFKMDVDRAADVLAEALAEEGKIP